MSCESEIAINATGKEAYQCNRPSTLICYECGTKICELHTEECGLCREYLCTGCMYIHMREPHAKPALTAQTIRIKKRYA